LKSLIKTQNKMKKTVHLFLAISFVAFTGMAFSFGPQPKEACDHDASPSWIEVKIAGPKGICNPDLLEWDSQEFNFGSIKQGHPVSHTFRFKNKAAEPVILTKVKPACGCTATDYPEEPIQPGEWASIKTTYNAKAMGRFRKSIAVNTDVPYAEATLFITGEVVK
jgi:hypothetical protein